MTTVRETIEHHIDVLCSHLESATMAVDVSQFVDRHMSLVDEFWAVYKEAHNHGVYYYLVFAKACGEYEAITFSHDGERGWPRRAAEIAREMRAQSSEMLYLMTQEAGMPEEYLKMMVGETDL